METRSVLITLVAASLISFVGCSPAVDVKDLGKIVYEVPEVPDYRTASADAAPFEPELTHAEMAAISGEDSGDGASGDGESGDPAPEANGEEPAEETDNGAVQDESKSEPDTDEAGEDETSSDEAEDRSTAEDVPPSGETPPDESPTE